MRKVVGVVLALVLLALTILTVARFLDTSVRWVILMSSFSSYAALGFLLVLLGCLFALRRPPRSRWLVVGALVAGVGLAVQSWVLVPLFVGADEERASDLTVMTSNLRFGRGDATAVVRLVAAEKVDVLVLEEVTPKSLARLVEAGLTELLPNRRGTPVVTAAGTMVFSRYPLTAPRPFELAKGGVDVRVAAPEPFRLLAVHAAYPLEQPEPWLTDLETVRTRTAAAVDRGTDVGGGRLQRDARPRTDARSPGLRGSRRCGTGRGRMAADLAHDAPWSGLAESAAHDRPCADESALRCRTHGVVRNPADRSPRADRPSA